MKLPRPFRNRGLLVTLMCSPFIYACGGGGGAGSAPAPAPAPAPTYEIVGYYPGYASQQFPVNRANIDATRLTTINYAFMDICWDGMHGNPASGGEMQCTDPSGDAITANGSIVLGYDPAGEATNLRNLVALKADNPKLKILVAVGGWTWSNQFSNMAASAATRKAFIDSTIALLRQYKLDGIDIDWEYPTSVGVPCTAGRICERPEDMQNLVILAKELRSSLDAAGAADGKRYFITIAAASSTLPYVSDPRGGSALLAEIANSLDWINLMTYDFHLPFESVSGLNAPLFSDPADKTVEWSHTLNADYSVDQYLNAGVPAGKLILGQPFYGYGWAGCAAGQSGDGLYQACTGAAPEYSFNFAQLTDLGYLTKSSSGTYTQGGAGFTRYWNSAARVPYLYNSSTKVFITYDDEESIREKNRYVRSKGLRGAMFWELNADRNKVLLPVVASELPH